MKIERPTSALEAERAYENLAKRMGKEPFASELEILVRNCKAGDTEAWTTLIDQFQSLVWISIFRVGLRNEDAEDTFQKVFVILYNNLNRIESALALPKWLSTTAAREAIRLQRVNRAKALLALDALEGMAEMIPSAEASIEDLTVAAAQSADIRAVISQLPGKCSQLLGLLYTDADRTYEDVRVLLGIPAGSIGPTRYRCIEHLRKALISAAVVQLPDQTAETSDKIRLS